MKKMIIMLVLGALAFVAQANIVNGTFDVAQTNTSMTQSSAISMPSAASRLNAGWATNTLVGQNIQITGGVAVRNTTGPGSYGGIGQYYTDTQTGSLKLKFDVAVTDADSDAKFVVVLYGYKFSTTFVNNVSVMSANDSARLLLHTSAGLPTSSTAWTVAQLINYSYALGSTSQTMELNFTGSAGYDFYGIRIASSRPDVADSITFDNVSVIPEPATVGMLGLGALITLLFRRMRR